MARVSCRRRNGRFIKIAAKSGEKKKIYNNRNEQTTKHEKNASYIFIPGGCTFSVRSDEKMSSKNTQRILLSCNDSGAREQNEYGRPGGSARETLNAAVETFPLTAEYSVSGMRTVRSARHSRSVSLRTSLRYSATRRPQCACRRVVERAKGALACDPWWPRARPPAPVSRLGRLRPPANRRACATGHRPPAACRSTHTGRSRIGTRMLHVRGRLSSPRITTTTSVVRILQIIGRKLIRNELHENDIRITYRTTPPPAHFGNSDSIQMVGRRYCFYFPREPF